MHLGTVAIVLAVALGSVSAQESMPTSIGEPTAKGEAKAMPGVIQRGVSKSRGAVAESGSNGVLQASLEEPSTPAPAVNPLPNTDRTVASIFDEPIPDNPKNKWWFGTEYMLWRTRNMPTNAPFVTTGPESDLFAGSLGRPQTRVLYGDKSVDLGWLSGVRLEAGFWLDDSSNVGLEISGMMLERGGETARFSGGDNGTPFFGMPFLNARTGQQNIFFVSQNFNDPAVSAFVTGHLDISSSSSFWTSEVNAILNLRDAPDSWLLGTLGFRSMGLDESIRFTESLRSLVAGGSVTFAGATIDSPQTVGTTDLFKTATRFYGPQVGTRFGTSFGGIVLSAHAAVAMGVNQQDRTIDGNSVLMSGGRVINSLPGGVYALSSNIGRTVQNDFSVVPEAGLSLGYQLTPWLTAKLGYNFIYWNNVARASQQVDSTINPSLVPTDISYGTPGGPNRPGAALRTSDFWAQGINFGIEIKR